MVSVSVLICTYGRGDSVVSTVRSVLANQHPDFEMILVDQNTTPETEIAIIQFLQDPRFHYLRSTTRGKGSGLNVGLTQCQGEFVLFTDDDCEVPPNWVEEMRNAFSVNSHIGMVFCGVKAGPHDPTAGFVPAYTPKTRLVRSIPDKCRARGIGAGMAMRKNLLNALGGFDECMGPGARFPAADEGDIALRVLLHHEWVHETDTVSVIHHGFRTWEEGKSLAKRDWTGVGAMLAKPIKCGHWSILLLVAYEGFFMSLIHPLSAVLRLRRPRGFKGFLYFCVGFWAGLSMQVDRTTLRYRPAR
jgi:glycosyltransferase involved in cell wall biosynthesis